MTIADIDAALTSQLQSGTLTLSPATFANDATLTPLLQQYFSATDGAVTVTGVTSQTYQYDSAGGSITFSGTGEGGPFDGAPIANVTITVAAGVAQVAIEGHPADGWTLAQGFPDLRSPILQEVPFKQPVLYWASFDDDTHYLGFYFEGNLDFDVPPLSFVKMFFPNLTGPQLWGQIEMVGTTTTDFAQYVPQMVLVLDESSDQIPLGPFTLSGVQFKAFADPYFNTFTSAWQTDSYLRIAATLAFKDNVFAFTVDIHDVRDDLQFEAVLEAPIQAGLSEIIDFVGGTLLSVPGFDIPPSDLVWLKDVKLTFDPDGPQLVKLVVLQVGADPGKKWPLWSGVSLENIIILFHLTPGASGYVVDGQISGDIDGWLGLRARIASDGSYTFYGGLMQPLPIKDVYTFFTGTTLDELPDLSVTGLNFTLDRATGGADASYSGEVTVDGTWPIVTSPIDIELDGLLFRVNHPAAASTEVVANGVLSIDAYTVGVTADYDSTNGWNFAGTVAAKSQPPTLADVVAKIESTFSITAPSPAVPPFLTGWFVQSLDASFATKLKNFDFTVAVGNAAVPALALGFDVHLIHSDTAFTKTFDGTATITTSDFDAAFALTLEESTTTATPPVTSFVFTGTYSATTPPKLSALLAWLSGVLQVDVNLPAELQIDAKADGFAIEVRQQAPNAPTTEVAGEFSPQIEGSSWNLYFAYTNATSFTPGGPQATTAAGTPASVFGVAISGLLDLSKLPLVGRIPGVDALRIDKLGFYYTNAAFTTANTQLSFNVPAIGDPGKLADPTAAALTKTGFTLMAVFGNQSSQGASGITSAGTMPLPVDTGKPAPGQQAGFAAKAATPTDPIHWLDVNKTFGPVSLQKIGVGYDKSDDPDHKLGLVSLYVDGAFKIAGFGMALDRLGVSVDVPKPGGGGSFDFEDDVSFHLGGLFVNYQAPSFQIGGGFITLPGGGVNFIGEFTVLAGEFGLQAYGGFSNQQAAPSLFLFVHVEAPIGGPPFFFINGLAGGFGVNRAFRLPTFDQLTNYPFLPASSTIPTPSQIGGDPSAQLATMMTALTSLADYVPVEPGEYWLAVGLDVSSFEMIEVSAVLSVAFGVEFQVGIVGSASMTLPVNEPEPIAYIQIDFEVVFSPANGLVAAFGKITPASFIYGGMVHLSGGFAFYTWFSGPNTGNYVVTIGGYNPRYQKPAIYPDVPRLQAVFAITSLNVTGEGYFALVPSAMMAGLQIHATWSLGPLDAWFDAGLDFLLNWKPFHYEADAYIQIGISLSIDILFVTIRITVHAGVSLEIWGPPLGGVAVVDLDIVSFTIRFGDQPVQESVDWHGFSAFLPSVKTGQEKPRPVALFAAAAPSDDADKPLVNITVGDGLLKAFKPGESPEGLDWLIDPNGFAVVTQSSAPCTDATFNGTANLKPFTSDQYVDPDDLRGSIAAMNATHHSPPFVAYKAPATGASWSALTFGIPPMSLTNIQSTHSVAIQTVDSSGNVGDFVNDLIAVLNTGGASQALWGNTGVGAGTLKGGQELIDGALTGVTILPMIWFPRRTTFIPYYYLVFDTNDVFLEQETLPAINTTPFAQPKTLYDQMDDGTLFTKTASTRSNVVQLLQQQGFGTLSLTDAGLNTGQYKADPFLVYFSHTDETKLAA